MTDSITIDYLANHAERATELARWFYDEWREYYRDSAQSLEDVATSFHAGANTDTLPLTLIAFCGDRLAGTVSLKQHGMEGRNDLSPWLAGLYVAPAYRGAGIGSRLVDASRNEARRLQIGTLHLWTTSAGLEQYYAQRGWSLLERVVYQGLPGAIMAISPPP